MRGERALEGGGVRGSLERLLSLPLTITTLGEQRGARACDPHITRTAPHLHGSGAVLECVKNFLTTSKKKKKRRTLRFLTVSPWFSSNRNKR